MNCHEVRQLLEPYSDDELDLVRHLQIEQHLAGCLACTEQVKHLRSLRTALSSASLYHRAPESLRTRIQTSVVSAERRPHRNARQLVSIAAGILVLVGMSATIGVLVHQAQRSSDDRIAEWVVADHVRSVQVDHLTDVASSDQHSVKPWFQGKLDFAPQVPDLSADGYELTGGRLDYLVDRTVAAVVYHRRLHVVNVLMWPANDEKEIGVRRLTRQGFHLRNWHQSGLSYWAISDLNDQELDEFVKRFQSRVPRSIP